MPPPAVPSGDLPDVRVPRATPLADDVAEGLDAKQRMVVTAARLFQRQGYHATGLKQVVSEARAPRGSIYHHFPGGKEDLGVLAVEAAATEMTRAIRAAAARADGPGALVRALGVSLARWLETSDYLEGCPVSTVTLETAPVSAPLTRAVRDAYRSWVAQVVDLLRERGVAPHVADALGTTVVAGIEGALLLCRAEESTKPLALVADQLAAMVDRAVDDAA